MSEGLSNSGPAHSQRRSVGRFLGVYVLPTLVLIVFALWPIIGGGRTLFFRDVMSLHLEMKWFQAEAMQNGYLPLVDPYRGGGQPHLGNPNAVALYPDNVLYLVADPFWALNAHFWIHLLLAPVAFFWLARAWGLGREAAWAGGVVFASSGYVLSGLNLYNMIATMAWAPALIAVAIKLGRPASDRRWLWALAGVWALLIVAGDPVTAVLALCLALSAAVARHGVLKASWKRLSVGFCLGTLLAAPLVLEFLRVLSLSYRGHWGYSEASAMVTSFHPLRVLELLVPLAFGRPDLHFWGFRFFSWNLPLLFSLSPGIIALALAVAGLRAEGAAKRWAAWSIGTGVFCALGGWNPLMVLLMKVPGAGLFRLPVKFWLLVAVGGAMLAALAIERVLVRGDRRAIVRSLGLMILLMIAAWLVLVAVPQSVESTLGGWAPAEWADTPAGRSAWAGQERLYWAGMALLTVLLGGAAFVLARIGRLEAGWVVPVLLVLHLSSQLFFLRPLYQSDEIEAYRSVSPAAAFIPEGARVVHGSIGEMFEDGKITAGMFPSHSFHWARRLDFYKYFPAAGMLGGRKYEFFLSPDGLDAFLTGATREVLKTMPDLDRIRFLSASGVEYLLLERTLDATLLESGLVELTGQYDTVSGPMHIYRLPGSVPEAQFIGTVHPSQHLNGALETILEPDFDPFAEAVLAGAVASGSGAGGTVATLQATDERMVWEVDAGGKGVLLVQRSHLPLYRARVDGKRVPVYAANLFRMAIPVDSGLHTVELWVDRSRFRIGLGLSLSALVALIVVSRAVSPARWLGFEFAQGEVE